METEAIQEGFDVFLHDGDKAVGAVRQVGRREIVIYIENAGDFTVPLSAVVGVHSEKVVLDCGKLETALKNAIGHNHEREDPRI